VNIKIESINIIEINEEERHHLAETLRRILNSPMDSYSTEGRLLISKIYEAIRVDFC